MTNELVDVGPFGEDPIVQALSGALASYLKAKSAAEAAERAAIEAEKAKQLAIEMKQLAAETNQIAISAKATSEEAKQIAENTADQQQHGTNDEFSFAIPWLKGFGIKVPNNYHSQVYKECKSYARGYNPELKRKSYNGFPTMRFDDKTLIFWVTTNRLRTDRREWFKEFKSQLFEEKRGLTLAPWPMKVTKSATEWVTDKFREKKEWKLCTLLQMAGSVGLGHEALHSPEVLSLPIRRTVMINGNGQEEWSWRACRNWPT